MNILNEVLQQYANVFISGLSTLQGYAIGTASLLATIDFILLYIFKMEEIEPVKTLAHKFITYGFFVFVINEWPVLLNAIVDSLTTAGAAVVGGGVSNSILKQPSIFINLAFQVIQPLVEQIKILSGLNALANIGTLLFLVIATMAIIVSFGIITVQVFVTYLEFYLLSSLAVLFVGFGTNNHTSFLANNAFGMVISFGVKFMVLMAIIGASLPLTNSLASMIPADPTWEDGMMVAIVGVCMAYFSWMAPNSAGALMSGRPGMSASGAVGFGFLASMAAGAAGGAIGSATRGAAGLAGAMQGGAAGKSGALEMAVGALGGAANHMGSGIFGGLKEAYDSGVSNSSTPTSGFASKNGSNNSQSNNRSGNNNSKNTHGGSSGVSGSETGLQSSSNLVGSPSFKGPQSTGNGQLNSEGTSPSSSSSSKAPGNKDSISGGGHISGGISTDTGSSNNSGYTSKQSPRTGFVSNNSTSTNNPNTKGIGGTMASGNVNPFTASALGLHDSINDDSPEIPTTNSVQDNGFKK